MPKKKYLSADEVAAVLEISKATLYAYVSRGLVRSEETSGKTRARRYNAEDVEALQRRKEQRRNPSHAVEAALHFGDPVLESAITLIADGKLYYRGYDALLLAQQQTFETVATLLWTGALRAQSGFAEEAKEPKGLSRPWVQWPMPTGAMRTIELFQLALLTTAPGDLAAYNRQPEAVERTGVRILQLLTEVATGLAPAGVTPLSTEEKHPKTIAQRLQIAWLPATETAAQLLNAVLILCADHELNVSSFTARCVASAGSTPYAAVIAGLAALQGAKHGGNTERVETLLQEAQGDGRRAVTERLKHGELIPGFGHLLYSDGDPRAQLLLEFARQGCTDSPVITIAETVIATVHEATQQAPNLDFGLVTLTQALGLPRGAALTLFALGRTAGWIGHIIEQYETDRLIRPRARYVGVQPGGLEERYGHLG